MVSKTSIDELQLLILSKYQSQSSHVKVLSFAKSFLKFLTKARFDTRYCAFEVFLERPRGIKARKNVTSRIITKLDIENVLSYIRKAAEKGLINGYRAQNYTAFVLFGAYTGQRSLATMSKLTVGQFREELQSDKPCIEVQSSQDKIKMRHYVPLHAQVIRAIKPGLEGKEDSENAFEYNSIVMWVKREKIPLTRVATHFTLGDLRKFCEQYGDILEWEQSNRSYILTHGVSGIEWKHYRHPLPDHVYDVYMKYWKDTQLVSAVKKL